MLFQFAVSSNLFGSTIDTNSALLTLSKFLLIGGIILYTAFAGLILRQIQIMSNTVKTSFTPVLWLFGIGHFIFSLLVLFYFLAL